MLMQGSGQANGAQGANAGAPMPGMMPINFAQMGFPMPGMAPQQNFGGENGSKQ